MGLPRFGFAGGVWFFFITGAILVALALKTFMNYTDGEGGIWLVPAVLLTLLLLAEFVWLFKWWKDIRLR